MKLFFLLLHLYVSTEGAQPGTECDFSLLSKEARCQNTRPVFGTKEVKIGISGSSRLVEYLHGFCKALRSKANSLRSPCGQQRKDKKGHEKLIFVNFISQC